MRWGLNKFYYNQHKNSLTTAYTLLMQAKYCDKNGVILPEHPSINQFRCFEKKYRKRQNYYISRNGLKDYQKNHRPLLGDGIQIQKEDRDCDKMPATLVTDMESEYVSSNFERIAELGVTIINLPAYRPEVKVKGSVEKFFDLTQGYFKPILKRKRCY